MYFHHSTSHSHKSFIQLQKKTPGCDYKSDTFNLPLTKGLGHIRYRHRHTDAMCLEIALCVIYVSA